MPTKQELEEKLVNVTKELNETIHGFYLKFHNLLDEQQLIKVKLEGKHYETS